MELVLESDNEQLIHKVNAELSALLERAELTGSLQVHPPTPARTEFMKGDPVTLFTIVLAAVGAGGALTVAMGEKGFLTQLARTLEKHLQGGEIRATLTRTDKGERIELEGSARQVEKMLNRYLAQRDR